MSEASSISFFVAEALQHARSLPIRDSRAFLKGLLLLTEDVDEVRDLGFAYRDVCQLDDRLDALQLKLKLPAQEAA